MAYFRGKPIVPDKDLRDARDIDSQLKVLKERHPAQKKLQLSKLVKQKVIPEINKGSHGGATELECLLNKLTSYHIAGSFASYLGIRQTLTVNFSNKELDSIITFLPGSKEVDLPTKLRKSILMASKQARIDRAASSRSQHKNFATSETAKYCRLFYRSTKLPPIPRDNITTRNSRTLITRDQSERPKAKNMRRLNKAIKETGHNTPSHLAYQEFGEVKTDPRDMFVETLGTSLPRVVRKNYHYLRSKETNKMWKPPQHGERSPASKQQSRRKVNIQKQSTTYINCGYDLCQSYIKESERRIQAVKNGQTIDQHWAYNKNIRNKAELKKTRHLRGYRAMSPRPVSPQPGSATNLVGTCHDAIDTDQAEKALGRGKAKRSTATDLLLAKYDEELHNHWIAISEPHNHRNNNQAKLRFCERRVKLFKDKLSTIHMLMCTLKNMRLYHLKQKKLTMTALRDLRVDPFLSKESPLRRGRSTASACRHIDNLSTGGSSSKLSSKYTLSATGRRGQKSSSSSLGSTSRVMNVPSSLTVPMSGTQTKYAGPHLETWEDLLAVNPRDGRKSRKKVGELAQLAIRSPKVSSASANKEALRRMKTPLKAKKSLHPLWRIIRKNFILSQADNTRMKGLVEDIQTVKKRHRPKSSDDSARIMEAARGDSAGRGTPGGDDFDIVNKIKIEWLKNKIYITDRLQKKLRSQYKNTVRVYKQKRTKLLQLHQMRTLKRTGLRFEDKPEIWDSVLIREANLHKAHANSEADTKVIDNELSRLFRFCTEINLRNVTSSEEKMRLITHSLPAYEILTLHTQIAIKFMLGNVLCVDPDMLDLWLKDRRLPVHQSINNEPIVPQLRLREFQTDELTLNAELNKLFDSTQQ